MEGRVSCISMPVETAPDWFQLLQLCCLDSGILHSLGEEKAHGSEGHGSLSEQLCGIHAPGDSVGQGAPGWLKGLAHLGRLPSFPWLPGHLGSRVQTPGPHS